MKSLPTEKHLFSSRKITCGGADDAIVLVNGLQELTDDQRNALNTLDLFLGVQKLLFQVLLLVLDVLLLDLQKLELSLQFLKCSELESSRERRAN